MQTEVGQMPFRDVDVFYLSPFFSVPCWPLSLFKVHLSNHNFPQHTRQMLLFSSSEIESAALKPFHMLYNSMRTFGKMLSIATGFLMMTDLFCLVLQTVHGLKMGRWGQCLMLRVKADQTERMEQNCTQNHQLCSWAWPAPAHTKVNLFFKAEFLGKFLLLFKRRILWEAMWKDERNAPAWIAVLYWGLEQLFKIVIPFYYFSKYHFKIMSV